MAYQRSLCHAPYGLERSSGSLTRRGFCVDHLVTPGVWISLCKAQVIHDQFVALTTISLSRFPPERDDHFVALSYS